MSSIIVAYCLQKCQEERSHHLLFIVFHHHWRCKVCNVPSCQQGFPQYKFTDFNAERIACTFGTLMIPVLSAFMEEWTIVLDFQPFSVVLNIDKSDHYRHANSGNWIFDKESYWCNFNTAGAWYCSGVPSISMWLLPTLWWRTSRIEPCLSLFLIFEMLYVNAALHIICFNPFMIHLNTTEST